MTSSTDSEGPESTADTVREILSGMSKLAHLSEAAAILAGEAGEVALGAIEPISGVFTVIEMFWETLRAMETEERGCGRRGWCYAVMYGALDKGTPPEPVFSGSLQGEDQDLLDKQAWDEGVQDGQQALANGTDGVALRNKILLRVAHDGDAGTTLNGLWQAACAQADDRELAAAYSSLSWPQPTGA